MFLSFSALKGPGGNGARVYQCCICGQVISYSDQLLHIAGRSRHLFVNPAKLECDFYTLSSCPGALGLEDATEAHTWFPGYRWRLAICGRCGAHLGWHYEAVSGDMRPLEFWGILVASIVSR